MSDAATTSRRAFLVGAVAVALAACRPRHRSSSKQAADPDREALDEALRAERSLLADYDAAAAAAASSGGMPYAIFRATHVAHVQALELVSRASTPAAPAYRPPSPVTDQPSAAGLGARLEEAAAGAMWDLTAAAGARTEPRRMAVQWLAESTRLLDQWRLASGAQDLVPLPGQPS